jgi:hypothetical protein
MQLWPRHRCFPKVYVLTLSVVTLTPWQRHHPTRGPLTKSAAHMTRPSHGPSPLTILLIYSQIYSRIFEMGYFAAYTTPGLMITYTAGPAVHLSAYPGSAG